uniref:Uncharacterized protein n=1 Tax=Amphimedon queenslandica TaxID=400682 RepID=A0A1X7TUM6_AMPQE
LQMVSPKSCITTSLQTGQSWQKIRTNVSKIAENILGAERKPKRQIYVHKSRPLPHNFESVVVCRMNWNSPVSILKIRLCQACFGI